MPSPYPTQVAAHSICNIAPWRSSRNPKVQWRNFAQILLDRSDLCWPLERSTLNCLATNQPKRLSVVCKGKELDAEILGCTTMRIFSWCRSAKHVKLTEWGLFVHASSLDQCTTGSLLKADLSGFFWFGSFGKPISIKRCSAFWVQTPQAPSVTKRSAAMCCSQLARLRRVSEEAKAKPRAQRKNMYTTCTRHVHTARSIFRKTIDSKTDDKNLRKFTAKKSSKQDLPVHVAFQRCFCQSFLEAGLAQSSSC